MSSTQERTVVIGGGVIGGMCAWYLAREGHRVTVVDQGRFGGGCSHGNCGYVSPSHVLPLTMPGAVRRALKSVFSSRSPFYVKPRLSVSLWAWMYRFGRHCNERDMWRAAEILHVLLQSSRHLYDQLMETEQIDCEWTPGGLIRVFLSEQQLDAFAKIEERIHQRFGIAARRLDSRQLVDLEPTLRDRLAGGYIYDCDAHLRPDRLMSEMKRKLIERGTEIVEGARVTDFLKENGRARAAITGQREIEGINFVVATGAWSPQLQQQLGCRLPIQPGKGYSLTFPSADGWPTRSMIFEQHSVAVTPLQGAFRVGSTMEFAGYDTCINPRRIELLISALSIYLREPPLHRWGSLSSSQIETWYGWRPMTWDSLPYIDRAPALKNVWIATGHNMLGVTLATATGKLVSELITGQNPHVDVRPLRLTRP